MKEKNRRLILQMYLTALSKGLAPIAASKWHLYIQWYNTALTNLLYDNVTLSKLGH